MTHNLDENLGDSFEFILEGNKYSMRYPSSIELRKILEEKDEKTLVDKLLGYITSGEGSPSFQEALDNSNVRKSKRFLKMVREELTSED